MSYRRPFSNSLLLLLLLGAIASATYLVLALGSAFLFSSTFQHVLVERAPSLEPAIADAERLGIVRKVLGHLVSGDPQQLADLTLSNRDQRHLGEVKIVVAEVLHLKHTATLTFLLAVFGGIVLCWRELQSISTWLGELASATGWMLFTMVALTTTVFFMSDSGIAAIREYLFDGRQWLLSESSVLAQVFSEQFTLEFARIFGAALVSTATVLLSTGYVVRVIASRPAAPALDWMPPPPVNSGGSRRRRRGAR